MLSRSGPLALIRAKPVRELLAQERFELIAAELVRLQVEIEADDGKWAGVEGRESVELRGELVRAGHA